MPRWVDRRRVWLLSGLLLLYVAGINGQWRHGPDTGEFATIGRNVAEGQGFTYPTGTSDKANPGLPYLIAANVWLFGPERMWPVVVLMTMAALLILGLTYELFRLHESRAAGVIVAVLLGITATFYRNTLEVLTDVPFMLGLMLFLVGHERLENRVGTRWSGWILLGVGFMVMALFRFVAIVVLAAFLLTMAGKAVRNRDVRPLVVLVVVVAAFFVLRFLDPRTADSQRFLSDENLVIKKLYHELPTTLDLALNKNVPRLLSEVCPEALFGNELLLDVIGGTVTVIALAFGISLIRRRPLWGLIVILFLIQWILFLPDIRYFLPILPLLAYAWWKGSRWIMGALPGRWATVAATTMLVLWVGMNLPRTTGFVVQQRSVPFVEHYAHGTYVGVIDMARAMVGVTEPEAIILADWRWATTLCFYSQRTVDWGPLFKKQGPAVPLYAVEPLNVLEREWLAEHQWQWGPALVEILRGRSRAPLVLRLLQPPPVDMVGAEG